MDEYHQALRLVKALIADINNIKRQKSGKISRELDQMSTTILELKLGVHRVAISFAKSLSDNQFIYEHCIKVYLIL